jgi:MFS family permease
MLTGIILFWSVSVSRERPSAGLGAAFLLIAVGQVFGAPIAGAVAAAAGMVVAFWALAGIAVVATLIRPRVEHPPAAKTWVSVRTGLFTRGAHGGVLIAEQIDEHHHRGGSVLLVDVSKGEASESLRAGSLPGLSVTSGYLCHGVEP